MGYKLPKHKFLLKFDGTVYEGAEVLTVISVPIGRFIEWQDLVDDGKGLALFGPFGDEVIESWNLEDDRGKPIEPTGKGLKTKVDPAFGFLLLSKWMEAVHNPPDPLYQPSANGSTSAEPSIPMVPLSESPGD